mgnify:CR=1 FL=1
MTVEADSEDRASVQRSLPGEFSTSLVWATRIAFLISALLVLVFISGRLVHSGSVDNVENLLALAALSPAFVLIWIRRTYVWAVLLGVTYPLSTYWILGSAWGWATSDVIAGWVSATNLIGPWSWVVAVLGVVSLKGHMVSSMRGLAFAAGGFTLAVIVVVTEALPWVVYPDGTTCCNALTELDAAYALGFLLFAVGILTWSVLASLLVPYTYAGGAYLFLGGGLMLTWAFFIVRLPSNFDASAASYAFVLALVLLIALGAFRLLYESARKNAGATVATGQVTALGPEDGQDVPQGHRMLERDKNPRGQQALLVAVGLWGVLLVVWGIQLVALMVSPSGAGPFRGLLSGPIAALLLLVEIAVTAFAVVRGIQGIQYSRTRDNVSASQAWWALALVALFLTLQFAVFPLILTAT